MVHPDRNKYRKKLDFHLPHFSDFRDPRFACAGGAMSGGNQQKASFQTYWQWLHCIGNWGEEHSMCKKMRWYVERYIPDFWIERFEERRRLGHYDYTVLYGAKPHTGFVPLYKPVKKNRKGAYEWWLDRDFEPLFDSEVFNWQETDPILYDLFIMGKKPVEE